MTLYGERMKRPNAFLWVLFALLLCPIAGAQSRAAERTWNKATFIRALNLASEGFRTLSANLKFTKLTAVVDHTEVETGTILVRGDDKVKINMVEPEPKEILFDGRRAQIYYPKMKQIQEFDLGKHKGMLEQFLLLGFGTRGDDLNKTYLIVVHGETRINGRAALEVELTPRDDKIRSSVHEIRIWFDLESWVPLQQKFMEFGGDNTTTTYTNVRVNPPIRASRMRLSAPRGTTRIKPQGGL